MGDIGRMSSVGGAGNVGDVGGTGSVKWNLGFWVKPKLLGET